MGRLIAAPSIRLGSPIRRAVQECGLTDGHNGNTLSLIRGSWRKSLPIRCDGLGPVIEIGHAARQGATGYPRPPSKPHRGIFRGHGAVAQRDHRHGGDSTAGHLGDMATRHGSCGGKSSSPVVFTVRPRWWRGLVPRPQRTEFKTPRAGLAVRPWPDAEKTAFGFQLRPSVLRPPAGAIPDYRQKNKRPPEVRAET